MYEVVEVPANPTAAAAVLNAKETAGATFVAWLQPPSAVLSGQGIFHTPDPE